MKLKNLNPILGLGLAIVCAGSNLNVLQAQTLTEESPEILVSAERYDYPKKHVASSVTVIDSQQIVSSGRHSVAEILRGVPGVDVVQSGPSGGNVAVFIRGANSEHTLVYIDGIEANDPISPTRTFDFANLSVDNIESIEIIRGPQTVLYGSDAIGGVILIKTKTGQGEAKGSLSVEGGSFGTAIARGHASGGDKLLKYSLGLSQKYTDGFSAAEKRDGNREKDGYQATTFDANLSTAPSEYIEGGLNVRYTNAKSDLDNFGGAFGDDPNRKLNDNQFFSRAEIRTKLLDGNLKQKIGYNFTNQWYTDNNNVDSDHPTDSVRSKYIGKNFKFDFQNQIKLTETVDAIAGYENETEQGSSSYVSESAFGPYVDILDDSRITNNGYFLQGKWDYEKTLITTVGGRVDSHSRFGTKETWKVGPSLLLGDTKISGTLGTGYKAPSVFQLFSSFGNRDLKPEESTGWDIGVEQTFQDGSATIGVTYFENDFDNLISFDPQTFISENIAKASSKGVEVFGTVKIIDSLRLDGSYTFTDTEDENTGQQLLRRARHKGRVFLGYQPSDENEFGLEMLMNGKRIDNDFSSFPASRTDLGGYVLLNLTATHKINEDLELFGRVDNLLDQRYQEVLGYGTAGLSGFGGVRYLF